MQCLTKFIIGAVASTVTVAGGIVLYRRFNKPEVKTSNDNDDKTSDGEPKNKKTKSRPKAKKEGYEASVLIVIPAKHVLDVLDTKKIIQDWYNDIMTHIHIVKCMQSRDVSSIEKNMKTSNINGLDWNSDEMVYVHIRGVQEDMRGMEFIYYKEDGNNQAQVTSLVGLTSYLDGFEVSNIKRIKNSFGSEAKKCFG